MPGASWLQVWSAHAEKSIPDCYAGRVTGSWIAPAQTCVNCEARLAVQLRRCLTFRFPRLPTLSGDLRTCRFGDTRACRRRRPRHESLRIRQWRRTVWRQRFAVNMRRQCVKQSVPVGQAFFCKLRRSRNVAFREGTGIAHKGLVGPHSAPQHVISYRQALHCQRAGEDVECGRQLLNLGLVGDPSRKRHVHRTDSVSDRHSSFARPVHKSVGTVTLPLIVASPKRIPAADDAAENRAADTEQRCVQRQGGCRHAAHCSPNTACLRRIPAES
jgi:hypothetical protein